MNRLKWVSLTQLVLGFALLITALCVYFGIH